MLFPSTNLCYTDTNLPFEAGPHFVDVNPHLAFVVLMLILVFDVGPCIINVNPHSMVVLVVFMLIFI